MRRAIQLRMRFSWTREGGIESESGRQDDGEKVEHRLVVVSADDRDQVDQGMGGQEAGASERRPPISRPPGSRGERETGDEEGDANVLDEMRVERPRCARTGDAAIPERAGDQHHQPVDQGGNCENGCYRTSPLGTSRAATERSTPG